MKKALSLIIAGSLGLVGIANASIVVNGDFSHDSYQVGGYTNLETAGSAPYGWTSIAGNGGYDLAGIGVGYLGATNQEIDLSGAFDHGATGMFQNLNTVAGQTYQLSLDVYTGGGYGYYGGVDVFVGGTELGKDLQGLTLSNSSLDRVKYTFDFTATSSSTNLTLMNDNGFVSHVGNVSAQATPEPSSILALGLPLIGFARKRFKK